MAQHLTAAKEVAWDSRYDMYFKYSTSYTIMDKIEN